LTALFYPLSITTISAGFLAFVMIILEMDLLLVGTVTLWFYFVSTISIYVITKEALKKFKLQNVFLTIVGVVGSLAIIALLLLLFGFGP